MSRYTLDVEELTVAWLAGLPGVADVGVEMPNSPSLPFVLVGRLPGGGDDKVTDTATVQLDVFAATRTGASDAAREVHARMSDLRPQATIQLSTGAARIDIAGTVEAPFWLNYRDSTLSRYVARYSIASRLITR